MKDRFNSVSRNVNNLCSCGRATYGKNHNCDYLGGKLISDF